MCSESAYSPAWLLRGVRYTENPSTSRALMTDIQKNYSTEKGVPLKLHENQRLSVLFNGFYHYIEFNSTPVGAIVIPRLPNGDFLLVELRRAPIFGQSVEFPRGGVEGDEAPQTGALRELMEETGYVVDGDAVTYLGFLGADTATLNGQNHVFLVDIPEGAVPQGFDTEEITQLHRLSPGELRQQIRDNKIFDGQTLAAYGMLQARM